MRIHIQFLIVLVLFVSACKSKKESHAEHQHSTQIQASDSNVFVTLSFISIGSGTDGKTRTAALAYIEKFKQEHSVEITTITKPWGREGEVDYCINLNSLTTEKTTLFITGLKDIVKDKDLVKLQELSECKLHK